VSNLHASAHETRPPASWTSAIDTPKKFSTYGPAIAEQSSRRKLSNATSLARGSRAEASMPAVIPR